MTWSRAAIISALALGGLMSAAVPASSQALSHSGDEAAAASGTALGWLRISDAARGRYAREIREISERHGVSRELVEAVIQVESAFNPLAVSPKGAQGLMQLMPRTANALGVQNAFDPRENIEGGVRHLRSLIGRYPGDLPRALAAYNAGEGAVDLHRGIPPYVETQRYVLKVLERHAAAAAETLLAPERAETAQTAEVEAAPPHRIAGHALATLPETPLIDEARRASQLTMPGVGLVERAEREPIATALARLRQQSLGARARSGAL